MLITTDDISIPYQAFHLYVVTQQRHLVQGPGDHYPADTSLPSLGSY